MENKASLTICAATGAVLTETVEGVTMPADYTFAVVNDFVHGTEVIFEELQWLALGMATEIEKLRADAARYRWLRDTAYHAGAGPNGKMVWCVTGGGCSTEEPIYGDALDAAIDATLKTPND